MTHLSQSAENEGENQMSTVLITGVSRGIGLGLAVEYLNRGWKVYGLGRQMPESLDGHDAFQFESCDLMAHDRVGEVLERLFIHQGHVQTVILNAGQLGALGDMVETPVSSLRDIMELNLWANKALLDALLINERVTNQVVAISSGASVNGNRGFSGYSISKAALNMLIRLYAREFETIHFCALAPGLVDTDMQEEIAKHSEDPRFSAFQRLKEKRNTEEMPTPLMAASRLIDSISQLPELVESGEYADVREERFDGTYPRR